MNGRRSRRSWRNPALAATAALSMLLFFVTAFRPALGTVRHGFPTHYTASRLVVEGRWTSRVYDNAWFIEAVQSDTGGVGEVYWLHPPTMSMVLIPLAWLDLPTARQVWLWFSLALLAPLLALLFKTAPLTAAGPRAAFVVYASLYAPLRETFRLGQFYVFILFLFAWALWSLQRRRPATAGVALGLVAAIKLSGGPLWLTLAARRGWREVSIALGTLAGLAALSLTYAGWDGWSRFAAALYEFGKNRLHLSLTAFQSPAGLFQHLFVREPWNPNPVLVVPWLAPILSLGVSLTTLVVTLWKAQRASLDLAYAAGLTLSVILLPLADEYHYTLLLLPFSVSLARVTRRSPALRDSVWLVLSAALCATPLPYKHPWFADGWHALFAYPRLYGGLLLWAWIVREMSHTMPQGEPDRQR